MNAAPIRVFLADDHEIVRRGIAAMIDGQDDMEVVGEAATATQARMRIPAVLPDVAVLDVRMPDGSPLQLSDYDFPLLTNNTEISGAYRQPLLGGDIALGVALKQQRAYSNVEERIYYPATSLATGFENKLTRTGEARLDYRQEAYSSAGLIELSSKPTLIAGCRSSNAAGPTTVAAVHFHLVRELELN